MIHKEGYATLISVLLFWTFVNGLICYFFPTLSWSAAAVGGVLFLFFLQFFRNPDRTIPTLDDTLIYAPADGKVVAIEDVLEPEFLKETVRMISIFMSPLNVHANRMPTSAEVIYEKYHPGKYLAAWHPKSSTENERYTTVIKNEHGTILLRQIAGALARRIVNYSKIGSNFSQGEEYGFIKFGSRVDIYLPLSFDIQVNINDKVTGNKDVIAVSK